MRLLEVRPARVGLLVVGLVLVGSLGACGGETSGDTTCGTWAELSAPDKRDLIRQGVDESDTDDSQAALDAATDEDLDLVAGIVDTECAAVDDDTTLDELDD